MSAVDGATAARIAPQVDAALAGERMNYVVTLAAADPALRAAMLERYRAAFPGSDAAAFERVFAILAAQRHAKVIGIFTRLWRRDGKPAYLVHIPRVWRLLERALEHPALAPVRSWFDRHVPAEIRVAPSERSLAS